MRVVGVSFICSVTMLMLSRKSFLKCLKTLLICCTAHVLNGSSYELVCCTRAKMNPNLSYEEKWRWWLDESKPLLWREMKMMVSFGAFFVHRILVFVHQISLSFGWLGVASEKVLVGGKFWCTWRSVWSYPDWWEEEDLVNNILNSLLLKVAAKSVWKVILTSVNRP